jgi:TonB family protein
MRKPLLLLCYAAIALLAGCAQPTSLPPRPVDTSGATCPAPTYPVASRRVEAVGITRVVYVVEPSGQVSSASIERSSGETPAHRLLDQAALAATAACRYVAVEGYGPRRVSREYRWELQ